MESITSKSKDEMANRLCETPIGAALLLILEQDSITVEQMADAEVACTVIANAVNTVDFWNPDHREIVKYVLSQGPRLVRMAHALLDESLMTSWFSSVDRTAQLWVGERQREFDFGPLQAQESSILEGQGWPFPIPTFATSTMIGELSAELIAAREYAADYYPQSPYTRMRIEVLPSAHVREINSPEDWHELCTEFPLVGEDGRLVPNWDQVAQSWDGVHLTMWGLITAEQVRVQSEHGWTELAYWGIESTVWLRNRFGVLDQMSLLDVLPESTVEATPLRYWGPDWDANPQSWRTRLLL